MFIRACPTLPSSNFETTKSFYDRLGFELGFEYPEEGYLILQRDQVELHFFHSPQHVREKSNHGAFVRVKNANSLSKEYERLDLPIEGIPRFVKAENKAWGICELVIIDPDGNLLRMGHILDSRSRSTGL